MHMAKQHLQGPGRSSWWLSPGQTSTSLCRESQMCHNSQKTNATLVLWLLAQRMMKILELVRIIFENEAKNKMTKLRRKKKKTVSGWQDLTPGSMYSLFYSFISSCKLSNSYNHMDKAELILKNEVCMNYELPKNIILIENKFPAIW